MKLLLVPLALILIVISIQGVRHHWRATPTTGVMNCKTWQIIDDGCSMLGICLKCEPICAPGTEPTGGAAREGCSAHAPS